MWDPTSQNGHDHLFIYMVPLQDIYFSHNIIICTSNLDFVFGKTLTAYYYICVIFTLLPWLHIIYRCLHWLLFKIVFYSHSHKYILYVCIGHFYESILMVLWVLYITFWRAFKKKIAIFMKKGVQNYKF